MRNMICKQRLILLLVVIFLFGLATVSLSKAAVSGAGWFVSKSLIDEANAPLTGSYAGSVTLQGIYTGVFTETLQPTGVDLGFIDLAFNLEQVGSAVNGYVSLEDTLVFVQEHTIDDQAVGPRVYGTYNGGQLELVSEKFHWTLSTGRVLPEDGRILDDKQASRKFQLITTEINNGGAQFIGEYRETVWGLTPEPITVVGEFYLSRPVFGGQEQGEIFLPFVKR